MGIFRRSRPALDDPASAIADFWEWWSNEGAVQTTAALGDGSPEQLAILLSDRVKAIHGDLAWELARGSRSEHVLVVTAGGDATLRATARRWLHGAPAPDPTWAYADLRQPQEDVEGVTLAIGEEQIDFARVVVSARRKGNRLDVTLHHPSFGHLAAEVRSQVSLVALGSALGEADTELWVGEVVGSEVAPLDAFGLAGLSVVVREVSESLRDDEGNPVWVVLSGETSKGPVLAVTQVPLSPLVSPELDQHVAVVVPYTDLTPEGFPGPDSLEVLRALEDHLGERLGRSGRLVAHQSQSGVRILHAYVDSRTPAAAQVKAAVSGWTQGRVTVKATADPSWSAVSHLRT